METNNKHQFCTFWLSERLFGVNILDVKEINPEVAVTPIFHAPEEVRGYVNIRGQIHLVLDLRLLLGFEKGTITRSSRIILFKPTAGQAFGVLVDQIDDVKEVEEHLIEDYRIAEPTSADLNEQDKRKQELIIGVCQLQEILLVILQARNFLKVL